MITSIINLLTIGAKIFSEERKRYYENKIKILRRKKRLVMDMPINERDMATYDRADRELHLETQQLIDEMVKEASE